MCHQTIHLHTCSHCYFETPKHCGRAAALASGLWNPIACPDWSSSYLEDSSPCGRIDCLEPIAEENERAIEDTVREIEETVRDMAGKGNEHREAIEEETVERRVVFFREVLPISPVLGYTVTGREEAQTWPDQSMEEAGLETESNSSEESVTQLKGTQNGLDQERGKGCVETDTVMSEETEAARDQYDDLSIAKALAPAQDLVWPSMLLPKQIYSNFNQPCGTEPCRDERQEILESERKETEKESRERERRAQDDRTVAGSLTPGSIVWPSTLLPRS